MRLWIEGKFAAFGDQRNGADIRGSFGLLYIGIDSIVNRSLLVGTYVQFDSMRQNSLSQLNSIEGTGWMIGPYATARLSENVFLQGRAAWGLSNNIVSPFLTYSDEFRSERWLTASLFQGWTWTARRFPEDPVIGLRKAPS